ncbi:hypothetical protein G3M48_001121 [Beauveria asiatica]|uniref:Uncharacterized protein n=1 Tax=Beauveria asiatica TaxID=1069075 RepID=A0AAW0S8K9_9HYPO
MTELTAWSYGPRLYVKVLGLEPSIAEVGEQLAWLGAALRSSPRGKGVCYCTPFVTVPAADVLVEQTSMVKSRFQIRFQFEEVENELSNGHCWHNMFRCPVVARGYPISRRTTTQTGLDMPLNMMACMVRTGHVVPFDSTWYLKGFSSLLALVERRDDLLLWHHICDNKGGRLSYFDHNKSSTVALAAAELENGRHVVGWCPDVNLYAGALEDVNYNAGASELPRPHATCVLDKLSISGGKFILGGVGISIGVRESPIHLSRDTYRDKMRWVSGQYAILWDVGDELGWLVNGANALLHMVRASLEDDLEWMQKHAQQSKILFKKGDMGDPDEGDIPTDSRRNERFSRRRHRYEPDIDDD